MTNLKQLILIAILAVACNAIPAGASAQNVRSYGDPITAEGAISTEEFAKRMKESDSLATKIEAEVMTSCIKKGCWMDVKMPDGEVMKVKFKDYGFFVPTEGLEGRHAVLQGYATKEVTDVATLRHYAEDAGKSAEEIERINEPREDLFFVADGVLITF
jgi:hypothetical protein